MATKTETQIRKVFLNKDVKDIRITVLNFNCSQKVGTDKSNAPNCLDYVDYANDVFPTIANTYSERLRKEKNSDPLKIADSVLSPVWISPSSSVKLLNPKPFSGDPRSEAAYKKLGIYETQQLLARYSNGVVCAALASKLKYDSKGTEKIDYLVDPDAPVSKDTQYVLERGLANYVDERTSDFVRYIASYTRGDGKTGFTVISGDHTFVGGSVDITRLISKHVGELRQDVKTDKYKGISIDSIPLGTLSESISGQSSVALCRALAGSILVADHLKLLKAFYGVTELFEIDNSRDNGSNKIATMVPIDDVIADYQKIKQYAVMAKTLNAIK